MARGRPSLARVLRRVDDQVDLLYRDYGGLPRAVEADDILREIWIEDTYHSSALEGNPLSRRQVADLLNRREASGRLPDALEVEGYSRAARWVYENAQDYPASKGVPLVVVRTIHQILVTPRWSIDPPDDHSQPGQYRRQYRKKGIRIAGSAVEPPPPIAIDGIMEDWSQDTAIREDEQLILRVEVDGEPWPDVEVVKTPLGAIAEQHALFERIHPFADGNGRTGRLLLNFQLLQHGYPPAVLLHTSRERYIQALSSADREYPGPLTELIARAIETNLNRFLIPELSGHKRLVPLSALAEYAGYKASYLSNLASSGRLRATREGRLWLSSRAWIDEYKASRSSRGRPRAAATAH